MAREVVGLYHGAEAAREAEERFDAVFKRGEIPDDLPEAALPAGDPIHLPAVMVAAGLSASSSQARRDIDAGAVRIDGEPVPAGRYDLERSALAGRTLAVGKRRMARIGE
jgi:tyrosyl-tRNA synthetase